MSIKLYKSKKSIRNSVLKPKIHCQGFIDSRRCRLLPLQYTGNFPSILPTFNSLLRIRYMSSVNRTVRTVQKSKLPIFLEFLLHNAARFPDKPASCSRTIFADAGTVCHFQHSNRCCDFETKAVETTDLCLTSFIFPDRQQPAFEARLGQIPILDKPCRSLRIKLKPTFQARVFVGQIYRQIPAEIRVIRGQCPARLFQR